MNRSTSILDVHDLCLFVFHKRCFFFLRVSLIRLKTFLIYFLVIYN